MRTNQLNPEVYDGLGPEAIIALELSRSGAQESALGFLVGKLKQDGYFQRLSDLPLGISHWKSTLPNAWKAAESQLSEFERFKLKQQQQGA